jgi:hypothetical protein
MDSSGVRNAAAGNGVAATGSPGHSRRRFEVLEECRGLILERLTSVIAQALTRMSDELTAEALRSVRSDQQQALLDAVMLVRENRMEIEGRFRRSFGDVFERRLFAMHDQPTEGTPSEAPVELELMSDDVIRDKLSVDRLIGRARSKLDPDQVLGMRARFGALLERDWFDESQHPASPEAVFEALKSALAELSPRQEVKVALLDAFEPHVSRNLNGIYAVVNERLRAHHVLPKIKRQVQTSADTGVRRSGQDPAPGAAGANGQMPGGTPYAGGPGHAGGSDAWVAGSFGVVHPGGLPGGSAMPMSGHAGAVDGPMRSQGGHGAGTSYPPGMHPGQHGGGGPFAPGGSASGGPFAGDDGVMMSPDDPLAALHHAMAEATAGRPGGRMHVARVLSNPAMFGVADIPVAPVRPPLVASLTALQRGPLPIDDTSMLPQIVERVREQGSPLDQITVEIVSMVFDYIYADRRLPDPIKQQLLRLQVVAVKAALLDRSFFARRQHPMRRLLDRISEVGADPDADLAVGAPLMVALGATVDRIIAEFDTNLEVFDAALASIDDIARNESERRAAEVEASSRAAALEEALAIAQEAARAELGRRIDKDSPAFVREFLNRWWTAVLARARSADDGDAAQEAWDAGLRTADYLVWSVAPKVSEDIPRLATVLPGLIRGLNHGLALVTIPAEARAAFFDELLRAHTLEIAAAKKRSLQATSTRPMVSVRLQEDGSVRFSAPRAHEVAAPAVSASDELLSPLKRGQLIELSGEEGSRLLKLAWISPARKLFILTRHPDESVTFPGAEFAFMLQRGQARVVSDDSTLDRAIGSVTGDMASSDALDLALSEPA